jgi:hypothetical protein
MGIPNFDLGDQRRRKGGREDLNFFPVHPANAKA